MPAGRPTLYRAQYCDDIIDYFEAAAAAPVRELPPITTSIDSEKPSQKQEVRRICAELPTLEGFACSIGISSKTLLQWAGEHAEFGASYARAKDIQFRVLIDRGLTRQYDATAFCFVAKNITHMKERVELTGDQAAPLAINVKYSVDP